MFRRLHEAAADGAHAAGVIDRTFLAVDARYVPAPLPRTRKGASRIERGKPGSKWAVADRYGFLRSLAAAARNKHTCVLPACRRTPNPAVYSPPTASTTAPVPAPSWWRSASADLRKMPRPASAQPDRSAAAAAPRPPRTGLARCRLEDGVRPLGRRAPAKTARRSIAATGASRLCTTRH